MSAQKEDDGVGYKRPPKAYRWQKGQCGNPGRKRKRALKGTAEIIDQLFAKPVSFIEDGSVAQGERACGHCEAAREKTIGGRAARNGGSKQI